MHENIADNPPYRLVGSKYLGVNIITIEFITTSNPNVNTPSSIISTLFILSPS